MTGERTTGVDILRVAELHSPEVVFLRLQELTAEVDALRAALSDAREALPDYAHPSLDAKRADQIARVGVILDAALGDEDARAALAALPETPA